MKIREIFKKAIERKASDVHLVVGLPPVLRIDGELLPLTDLGEITQKGAEEMIMSLLDEDQKRRFVAERDLDVGFSLSDQERFRVNLHYERGNMGLVARVISEKMPTLDELGMPAIVKRLAGLDQGLILVTGPTGCGKSTTLAAVINHINTERRCNIITLEDPIEYVFKSAQSVIIQRQLGSDMTNFANGLKHALRQDPDVIMVGEMRDLETISTALTLAETGHLVLATLHTYSAAQTVDRIIDIFPPHQQNQIRTQLSMTLAAVMSQRLLPKIGGGQVAARELLLNTPAVANLIRENKISQIRNVIETGVKDGMLSMDQSLKELYESKQIELEIAKAQISNPELLEVKRGKII